MDEDTESLLRDHNETQVADSIPFGNFNGSNRLLENSPNNRIIRLGPYNDDDDDEDDDFVHFSSDLQQNDTNNHYSRHSIIDLA